MLESAWAAVPRFGPVALRSWSGVRELGTRLCRHPGRPAQRAPWREGQSAGHRPLWLVRGIGLGPIQTD